MTEPARKRTVRTRRPVEERYYVSREESKRITRAAIDSDKSKSELVRGIVMAALDERNGR